MDKYKQIENLFGSCDWFVSKSRVIIITRDEHLVATLGKVCTSYEVKELDKHEALEIFSQHAFHGKKNPGMIIWKLQAKLYIMPKAFHQLWK